MSGSTVLLLGGGTEEVVTVTEEHFPDRDSAHVAERAAIVAEVPSRNVVRYVTGARPAAV